MSTTKKTQAPSITTDGHIEFVAKTGRKFIVRELNGLEQTRADRFSDSVMAMAQYRAAFSVLSIDGQPCIPITNNVQMDARLQSLKGSELNQIMSLRNKYFESDDSDFLAESEANN